MFSIKKHISSNDNEIKGIINDLKSLKKETSILQICQVNNAKNNKASNNFTQKPVRAKQNLVNSSSSPFSFVKLFNNDKQTQNDITLAKERKGLYEKYYENFNRNSNLNKEFLNATKKISRVAHSIKRRLKIPELSEKKIGKMFCCKSSHKKTQFKYRIEKDECSKENEQPDIVSKKILTVSTNINIPTMKPKKSMNQIMTMKEKLINPLENSFTLQDENEQNSFCMNGMLNQSNC